MSPRRRAAALVAVALLALVPAACGDDGEATTPTTAPPGPGSVGPTRAVPELQPLEVQLSAPGAEPRAPLRHRIAAGTSWQGDLAFTLAVDTVATATVTGPSRIDHRSVDPQGTTSAAYALDRLDVALTDGPQGTDRTFPEAVVISGQLLVDADRTVQEATVETEVTNPDLAAGIQGFASALDPRLPALLIPFPTEPVGVGAEWVATGPLTFFGNQVRLSTRVTLLAVDADGFRVDLSVSMTTPDDTGNDIELAGAGQASGRFDTLGPEEGVISLDGTISLPDRSPLPLPMGLDLEITGR